MSTPTAEIALNAPKDTVWAAMADFGGITVASGTLRSDTKFAGLLGRRPCGRLAAVGGGLSIGSNCSVG